MYFARNVDHLYSYLLYAWMALYLTGYVVQLNAVIINTKSTFFMHNIMLHLLLHGFILSNLPFNLIPGLTICHLIESLQCPLAGSSPPWPSWPPAALSWGRPGPCHPPGQYLAGTHEISDCDRLCPDKELNMATFPLNTQHYLWPLELHYSMVKLIPALDQCGSKWNSSKGVGQPFCIFLQINSEIKHQWINTRSSTSLSLPTTGLSSLI